MPLEGRGGEGTTGVTVMGGGDGNGGRGRNKGRAAAALDKDPRSEREQPAKMAKSFIQFNDQI